ncbi:MAG: histidine phosphatase family protein [Anaerolineae bacterium]|nr:histidine phosphatase family protein [Anaerolineae bacterium]
MTIFYLIRHARAKWTPDEDRPLSMQGHVDAACVAEVLAAYPIQAIYSSPYARAVQTVTPLADRCKLPIHIISDLRERQLSAAPVPDFLAAVAATWHDPTFAHPGGESNAEAQRRGVAVVYDLCARREAAHIVLATHGSLLALILQYFDPTVDFYFWQSLTMPDIHQLNVEYSIVNGCQQVGRVSKFRIPFAKRVPR